MKFLKFIKKIYDGEKSTVYHALDSRNNRHVICKENAILSELKIHSLLTHKNIVEMICGYKNKNFCLLMEYFEGLDLYDLIDIKGYLNEDEAYLIFTQVYSAVKYLHDNKIVHRDIKPENILINLKNTEDNVKLCDFGFATFFNETDLLTLSCGSIGHAPPEILRGDPYIGPEIDVWCLGSCLYMMVTGVLPVRINEEISCLETFGCINKLSSDLESLLRGLLDNNPKTRINMEEIKVHPWVMSRKYRNVKGKNDFILDSKNIQVQKKLSIEQDNERSPLIFYSHVLDLMRDQGYDLENNYNIYKMIIIKILQGYSINEIFFLSGFVKYGEDHLKNIKLDTIQPTCFISCFNRPKFSFRFQSYLSLEKVNLEINKLLRERKLKVKYKIQLESISKEMTGRIIHKNGSIYEFKKMILLLLNVNKVFLP